MATDLTKLTKLELEALGREYDIELDRRLTKAKLVEQLDAHIKWCACGKTEDPNGACDGSHAKKEEAPLETDLKVLRDETGAIITFSDASTARKAGNKNGGRPIELNGHLVVKLY
jgi:CDGSH-type Zn-finger protein